MRPTAARRGRRAALPTPPAPRRSTVWAGGPCRSRGSGRPAAARAPPRGGGSRRAASVRPRRLLRPGGGASRAPRAGRRRRGRVRRAEARTAGRPAGWRRGQGAGARAGSPPRRRAPRSKYKKAPMANTYGFEGRVALVTGGASGIGAAVVARLEQGGAEVHVFDLANGQDVSDPARVNAAVEALPRLDVLVCAAGVERRLGAHRGGQRRGVAACARDQPRRRLLREPRRHPEDEGRPATAASSTSRRSPARRATRWRAPTRPRRPP